MKGSVHLVRNDIGPFVERYSAEMGIGFVDAMRLAARGAVRRVIDLTPPAHNGITGAAAYRYGREKIERDMRAVLVPVKLKGSRLITHVFGRQLATPVRVKTTEMFPSVSDTYRRHRRFRRSGVGVSAKNLGERKYWVDIAKFNRVLREKQSRLGRLAAGWAAGAIALDVPLQNWIARHGPSNGRVVMANDAGMVSIRVENFGTGVPDNVKAELARRIPYALQYQAAAMERAIRGRHLRLMQARGRS